MAAYIGLLQAQVGDISKVRAARSLAGSTQQHGNDRSPQTPLPSTSFLRRLERVLRIGPSHAGETPGRHGHRAPITGR